MVAEDDDFVRESSVDDANDVPDRRGGVVLLVDEVENEGWRRGTDVV